MNTQYFPHFVKLNYKSLKDIDNMLLIELGNEFKTYLKEKFVDKMDKLEPIWNIEPKTIIMNQVNKNPFTVNGYHPALILLFDEFITVMKNY